jgi:hypothetical protein
MAHSVNDFFAAVDPVANRHYYGLEGDVEQQFKTIFKIGSDDEPQKSAVEYGGPASLSLKTENAAVSQKTITQGPIKTWNAATYAGAATISYEAARDVKNRYGKIASTMGSLGRATKVTPELLSALFLDRAFNSAYPATADALELCSTAHLLPDGVTTTANELTTPAALDETSAEDVKTALRSILGPDGNIMPHKVTGWIVPSALANTAEKLSRTEKTSGSANNEISVVKGTKVLNFDYLGSATRWFAKTDNTNGLFWDWVEKEQFITDQVVLMLQKVYVAFFRARYGCVDFRGIYGSAAT